MFDMPLYSMMTPLNYFKILIFFTCIIFGFLKTKRIQKSAHTIWMMIVPYISELYHKHVHTIGGDPIILAEIVISYQILSSLVYHDDNRSISSS
jgi:hypothetical protein